MREIKFRGMSIYELASGERWLYGNAYISEHAYIEDMAVVKKTVGQYTGLKDKNGNEIFEGDIVQFKSIRDITERYEVEYTHYGEWAIGIQRLSMRFANCEVIGNIHENPELLEVAG